MKRNYLGLLGAKPGLFLTSPLDNKGTICDVSPVRQNILHVPSVALICTTYKL